MEEIIKEKFNLTEVDYISEKPEATYWKSGNTFGWIMEHKGTHYGSHVVNDVEVSPGVIRNWLKENVEETLRVLNKE